MTSRAVILFLEAFLLATAISGVMVLCCGEAFTCLRVVILRAILLPTCPAPCATTSCADVELARCLKTTRKDIGTGIILQAPPLTPGAYLSVS